jgi:hypothetical protein
MPSYLIQGVPNIAISVSAYHTLWHIGTLFSNSWINKNCSVHYFITQHWVEPYIHYILENPFFVFHFKVKQEFLILLFLCGHEIVVPTLTRSLYLLWKWNLWSQFKLGWLPQDSYPYSPLLNPFCQNEKLGSNLAMYTFLDLIGLIWNTVSNIELSAVFNELTLC